MALGQPGKELPDMITIPPDSNSLQYESTVEKARVRLRERVLSAPNDVEAWFNLGILSRDAGDAEDAEGNFQTVLVLDPGRSDACVELGLLRRRREDLVGAVEWYEKALALDPQSVSARFNLANCARDNEDFDAAIANYSLVLRMEPDHHGAWINLGYAYHQQVRYAEAMQCYQRALTLRPHVAGTYINIGNLLNAQNECEGAIAAYRVAIQLDPGSAEAHHSLGLALLATGDFTRGWKEYEWRLQCQDTGGRIGVRKFSQPLWRGEELRGKTLFVYAEQGLGDNIQFSRFLPQLRNRGGKVIFACYPNLMRLFARFTGVDMMVDLNTPERHPPFDTYTALLSIPALLGISAPGSLPPERLPAGRRRTGEPLDVAPEGGSVERGSCVGE